MRGPIDYIVVKFPGNHFEGKILSALDDAVQGGVIAILDLAIISKDASGELSAGEVTEFYETLEATRPTTISPGLINADDVSEVGSLLENNSSAGPLIIEQLWARKLKAAITGASGELIAEGRIHPEAALELEEE